MEMGSVQSVSIIVYSVIFFYHLTSFKMFYLVVELMLSCPSTRQSWWKQFKQFIHLLKLNVSCQMYKKIPVKLSKQLKNVRKKVKSARIIEMSQSFIWIKKLECLVIHKNIYYKAISFIVYLHHSNLHTHTHTLVLQPLYWYTTSPIGLKMPHVRFSF